MDVVITKSTKSLRKNIEDYIRKRIQLASQKLSEIVPDSEIRHRVMETYQNILLPAEEKAPTSKSSASRRPKNARLCEVPNRKTGEPCMKPVGNNPVYCSRHAPKGCMHIKGMNGKKEIQCLKAISLKSSTGHYCRAHLAMEDSDESKLILHKNQWGKMCHPKTGFVFNSRNRVEGFQTETGSVIDSLTVEDLECVYNYGFKIAKKYSKQMKEFVASIDAENNALENAKPKKSKKSSKSKKSIDPVEDEPVEDEPVEDEPVEDEPVEDEPVEDEPVEDEPVEDEPVEDEPVEDEPVEDELDDDIL